MIEKQNIIFMVTNGAGLGHLTRGLAVAKRLRALNTNLEIIFFTTSLATEVIRSEGFMYFYMPTKSLLPEEMTAMDWTNIMCGHLEEIVALYHPIGIVYDGAMPYSSVIIEMQRHRKMKSIWLKRESYKPGWDGLNAIEKEFDLIIVPQEFGQSYDQKLETNQRKYCHPITLIDESEAHSREVVRQAMAIKENQKLFYIQLGAGNINDIKNPLEAIQRSLLKRKHAKVILAESMIGRPIQPIDSSIKVLRNYPNAQYFKGIDFAISAAGYNTFNELVRFRVPTLFIPNEYTLVDDQVKRVVNLEEKQAVLRLKHVGELDEKIEALENNQRKLIKHLKEYQMPNGAMEAAKMIVSMLIG